MATPLFATSLNDAPSLDPARGLVIVDVDEVLALFVRGFDRFLRARGFELRMTSFGLFTNLYALEGVDPEPLEDGRRLLGAFFAEGCGALEPVPGAAEGLAALASRAQIVILTNAPETARQLRGDWLKRHGMDYPMLLGEGLKGPMVAALAAQVEAPAMFVDDLKPNLDSVADAAPHVRRFQLIADETLRRFAPTDPERHQLVEHWGDLVAASASIFDA